MNDEHFRKLYMSDFKQDQRQIDLDAKITQYYRDTDDCTSRVAAHYWKDFRLWCSYNGYTSDEINKAKMRCAPD